jgi:hypothetical protein
LVYKHVNHNRYSGISNRLEEIASFLNRMNYEVEYLQIGELSKAANYDLICISSFTNAFQIIKYRRKTSFVWFDAMDSWKLTRRAFFMDNPTKEILKLLRDFIGSKLFVRANLITYCSMRDALQDGKISSKTFIFPPTQRNKVELSNFGPRYVFVGPSSYPPNREAFEYLNSLAEEGYFDEVNLHLYGESKNYKRNHPNVKLHGHHIDGKIYGVEDIHLVPIWSGAGIKYKTLMPLSQGITVFSSTEGANGIADVDNLFVAQNKEEFETLLKEAKFPPTAIEKPGMLVLDDQLFDIASILTNLKETKDSRKCI